MKNIKTLSNLSATSLSILLLSACAGNGASHLPSPIEFPGAVIGTVIENTTYNARRRKVEAYVVENYLAMRQEAKQGGGATIEGALNVAGIRGAKRDRARKILSSQYQHNFRNANQVADVLLRQIISIYGLERVDKPINGYTSLEVRQLITEYAQQNFEALRIAIQNGRGHALQPLLSKLRINDSQKRAQFVQRAKASYKAIYIEPVVVLLMVHS